MDPHSNCPSIRIRVQIAYRFGSAFKLPMSPVSHRSDFKLPMDPVPHGSHSNYLWIWFGTNKVTPKYNTVSNMHLLFAFGSGYALNSASSKFVFSGSIPNDVATVGHLVWRGGLFVVIFLCIFSQTILVIGWAEAWKKCAKSEGATGGTRNAMDGQTAERQRKFFQEHARNTGWLL
jgi:hypothetical protein